MQRIVPTHYEIGGVYESFSWPEAAKVAQDLGECEIVAVSWDQVQPLDLTGTPLAAPAPRPVEADDGDEDWLDGDLDF